MASTCSLPAKDAEVSIRKTGVFRVEDAPLGRRVAEFSERGLPTRTEFGLEFCAENTLDNRDIRTVIESILDRPRWGLLKIYSDKLPSDSAFFFHNPSFYYNQPTPQIPTLLVQLWSPGSQMVFYEGSHLQNINPMESKKWGLLTLPCVQMRRDGITETPVGMAEGGLAIMDSRLGFTIPQGYVVNIGFATESEIQFWAKMELPDSEALRAKVDELRRRRFETNFTFVKELDAANARNK
ncbi:hypothetical protein B0J13DRAFT_517182 [Dactylonectria estremocensis]|uniref:Uncharacterized protein n=1 Tax=Dactylonectria estremocensis TaxID=1079267 RepID=A0A9P9CXM7_9HYPO|nr:hypothetical protein B0J13DRAFT_517182 [Dactylonectria estremocensis]